ncbi:MBL fold metallo-hydrolase [Legionella quateirensis]|uniref:Metal-dependent hydrolase n=1 Tax=Legionella quateirensis TaxID=45072 RepID=A0A378KUM8_9GAMM|nr:MBL fold metallo-hydrolase [Legionella quateirensis]KTD52987.1 metal-dependent hydrolase [Legionella quateirensis]STY17207.1 metal-dependent hydrolase [Legionella quateirensis]
MQDLYYLKPNVISQPLVNQWYAWSFLVAPQTAAMLIVYAHLAIMKSYINHPEMHEQALLHPELKGGQFIDLPVRDTEFIAQLLAKTEDKCSELINLAQSITELFDLLNKYENGAPLEDLYSQIPEQLRGYVELVYDLQNQKSFRFFERMLYSSKYSTRNLQSVVLSEMTNENRPFLLSTPYQESTDKLEVSLPFNDSFYDKLYQSKTVGITETDLLALHSHIPNAEHYELFKSFFTTQQSEKKIDLLTHDSTIKIKYFGHACVLVMTKHCSILIDPIISYETPSELDRFCYADLPETIDYLVFTHAHQDHVLIEHVLQLRYKTKQVIVPKSGGGFLQDPSLKIFFEELGFTKVIEIDDMESIDIPDGSITGIPFLGEHGDLNIQTKKAHLITLFNKKMLFAADSNNLSSDLYNIIYQSTGTIDLIFIGMECEGAPVSWVYGTLFPNKLARKHDQKRRLNGSNCDRALKIIEIFKPKQVFVYAMALEPWLSYILNINYNEDSIQLIESTKFIKKCNDLGIFSERLFSHKEIFI